MLGSIMLVAEVETDGKLKLVEKGMAVPGPCPAAGPKEAAEPVAAARLPAPEAAPWQRPRGSSSPTSSSSVS